MENQNFLEQMKLKCQAKAKEMARLELSCWNDKFESELTKFYGFNQKTLAERKSNLINLSK